MLKKTFYASASEIESSDIYMTIKATQFTVPDANLNGVRCTEAFIDDIVEHQERYIGLPLCADVGNLVQGRYESLGHLYDPETGSFGTAIIGSFIDFDKQPTDNGYKLVGTARVMKRNKAVCKALCEIFADNALKFSFEIACGEYSELEDGTILIDKAAENYLEGMCVVSFPACPEAVAMQLVAEMTGNGGEEKEAETMPEVANAELENIEVAAEEAKEEVKETAETEAEPEEAKAEEVQAEEEKAEEAEEEKAEEEEAAKKKEEDRCGEETAAEAQKTEETEAPEAAVPQENLAERIDKLYEMIAEVLELQKKMQAQEEKEPEVEAPEGVQPFMAEISAPKQYSLLEREEKPSSYTLI